MHQGRAVGEAGWTGGQNGTGWTGSREGAGGVMSHSEARNQGKLVSRAELGSDHLGWVIEFRRALGRQF